MSSAGCKPARCGVLSRARSLRLRALPASLHRLAFARQSTRAAGRSDHEMKLPVSWLREYVTFDMPVNDLASTLVFTSFEVDRIVRRGVPDLDGNLGLFRVGRVLEAGKHPNADRLQLCQVDVGEGEPRQIVCGAWNFGPGATVAVALPGARLPGSDEPLGEARLRGELSRGMILSEQELELGVDDSGIIVLDDGAEPGTPLADVLPLVEDVLEIETGFNRPDLMGIYGIARDVAAVVRGELAPVPGTDPERAGDEPVDVRVEDFEGCPRYVGRLFRGASVGQSPIWMKARLLAAGMRPISNLVDVTNYVMLALGSPLHAFDLTRLQEGRIVVRRARSGETITTLDGQERPLTPDDLVIADATRPVAVAGIMGGEDSEVRPETTDVLLEAANFDPLTVLRSSRRLRLRTESSTRWEKGVDPHAAVSAQLTREQRLRRLVEDALVGGGYYEAYTWTLVPAVEGTISLEEPYSREMAALRSDLQQGLVESAERNRNAGVERIALFELARVFVPSDGELPDEQWHVGGIADGGVFPAKGAAELPYHAGHVEPSFKADGKGTAHTEDGVLRELEGGWGYFELDLDALFDRTPDLPLYEDVITYPPVKHDLAFAVDEAVLAGDLVSAAREAAGGELYRMTPFDVYRGEQVGAGRKSIAFRVEFRSPERTLTDEEAAGLREKIVAALSERFGAELRS